MIDIIEERKRAARERARIWKLNNPERAKENNRRWYASKPKKGRPTESRHFQWKGDNASYEAIHIHIRRIKGAPKKCEHCGTVSAKRYEWANKDHKYSRNPDDYMRLCTSCHRRYDYQNGLSMPRQPKSLSLAV